MIQSIFKLDFFFDFTLPICDYPVVIGGIKGGAGKSTTAANLAARRATDGYDVLLVDGDDQETTTLWASTRSENFPEGSKNLTCIQLRGRAARDEVLKLSERYQDIIIDVGGRDTTTQRAALTIANILLLPMPTTRARHLDTR